MSETQAFLSNVLYLLALINPISKVFILSVLSKQGSAADLRRVVLKSSAIALAMLLVLGAAGNLILAHVFHVQMHSLQVAGGIVLFFIGYHALSKGVFFEVDEKARFDELSIVPLASPMIAGPAAITAAISLNQQMGVLLASGCIVAALVLNHLVMSLNPLISTWMIRHNIMGPLIRITGLIVAAIAVEMVLGGLGHWLAAR